MSKKIITIREGEPVPDGAKFLSTDLVPDYSRSTYRWRTNWDIGLFSSETKIRITPRYRVFFYEIDDSLNPDK